MPISPLPLADLTDRFRREMPVADRWAYFDHAAVAPISRPARDALAGWAAESASQGDTAWAQWSRRVAAVRQTAATLLGAAADEVAFVHNTTHGISQIAEGFPWRAGDNVVTLAHEFPSNQYPWLHLGSRGVESRRVEMPDGGLDFDRLVDAIDGRTRLVAVSWVNYAAGWRTDLETLAELVHGTGALLLVDAIQGLGVFPIDVTRMGVDFLAADGHKWLLGPEGAGLLYVRRDHLEKIRPTAVGWHSVVHDHDFTRIELALKPTAQRFEGGSENIPGVLALGASIQLLLDLGIANIAKRILTYTDAAGDALRDLGAILHSHRDDEHSSGIISFELPGRSPDDVRRHCLAHHVALGCRAGRLRISPHAYQNEADLARLLAVLTA